MMPDSQSGKDRLDNLESDLQDAPGTLRHDIDDLKKWTVEVDRKINAVSGHLEQHLKDAAEVQEFIKNYHTAKGAVSWLGKAIIWTAAVVGGVKAIMLWGSEIVDFFISSAKAAFGRGGK